MPFGLVFSAIEKAHNRPFGSVHNAQFDSILESSVSLLENSAPSVQFH